VDTGLGQMTGSPRRVTREGSSQFPSLSADGKVLAYASSRSATVGNGLSIYARNVDTGEEAVVVSSPERKGYTTLSRDGSKIAYGLVVSGQKRPIYIYDRTTRTTRKLCDDCEGRPYDWSPDGTKLILSTPQKGIGLMDVNTGERSVILPGAFAPVTRRCRKANGYRSVTRRLAPFYPPGLPGVSCSISSVASIPILRPSSSRPSSSIRTAGS
jgi:WD40 repeat protein